MNLMGAELPKGLLGTRPSNKAGHWEVRSLLALHEAMLIEAGSRWDDWRAFDPSSLGVERRRYYEDEIARLIAKEYGDAPLFVIKDPRMCRFVPLYETILANAGVKACYVLPQRNPLAVVASLSARDGLTKGFAGLLWLRHVLDAEAATRNRPRIIVSYESFLDNWRNFASDIGKTLGIDWPRGVDTAADEIEAHITHDLWHYAPQLTDLDRDTHVTDWIKQTYAAVLTLTGGAPAADALATLDRVRGEFDSAASIFGPAFFPELAVRELRFDSFWNHVRAIGTDQSHQAGRRAFAATPKADIEAVPRNLEDKLSVATEAKEQSDRAVAESEGHLKAQERRARALEAKLAKREDRNKDLTAKLTSEAAKARAIEAKLKKAELMVQALRNSTSWRITAPLRLVSDAIRRQPREARMLPVRALPHPRGLLSRAVRTIYYRTPLPYPVKISIKEALFRYASPLFRSTIAYRDWHAEQTGETLGRGTAHVAAFSTSAQTQRQGRDLDGPTQLGLATRFEHRTICWDRRPDRSGSRGVTVITPTGDRAAAFSKCAQWVTTQTVAPDQWIIVDDGDAPLLDTFQFPDWVTYLRRKKKPSDATHTLCENILEAIPHIRNTNIFIFEDDDWYAPHYIEFMLPFLEKYDLVGTNTIAYYHLQGRVWKTGKPREHTALAQTAFTSNAVSKLREVCESGRREVRERGIVDRHWWLAFKGNKCLIQDHPHIHVGFKGLFGRPGVAEGHASESWGYKPDEDLAFLEHVIGDDVHFYREWSNKPKKPWVIYTAIAGNYDVLREPIHDNPLFDFIVFSDRPQVSRKWRWIPFDEILSEAVRTAKKPKILPHIALPQYEWSIWIDANISITGDLLEYLVSCIESGMYVGQFVHPERDTAFEESQLCLQTGRDRADTITDQMQRYESEGFRRQRQLYECNFILRRHRELPCIDAMNRWWSEIRRGSSRDQISYPYALWKAGLLVHALARRGTSVRNVNNLYYSRHGPISIRRNGPIDKDSKVERKRTLNSRDNLGK